MHGDLDAVILAGGKSERLRGIVPPYHKPFLVVGGRSLLVAAVEAAAEAGAGKIVVVATGENAMPVMQLVGHMTDVRIVLSGGGPGQALLAGLEMCDAQRVLVLMSDNVHGPDDVAWVVRQRYAVGYREVKSDESLRFTRLLEGEMGFHWVEGPEHPASHIVWCGPLVIDRTRGLDLLPGQEKIGPVLDGLVPNYTLVRTNTLDVGVPDVVQQLT